MTTVGRVTSEFWRGRRVMVTGNSGFKGSWLVAWLDLLGAKVSGFALGPPTKPSAFDALELANRCEWTQGDIRDARVLEDALQRAAPEVVFHLAAQPLVRLSYEDPVGTYATNVMGTVHLLDAVRRCGSVRAVINVTSDKCYENLEWVWGYRENDRMGGRDPYSNSKGCSELVTAAMRASFFPVERMDSHRVAIASARAGNVIGGGDWNADRLIPDAVRSFVRDEPVSLRNPESTRPWQHVLEPLRGYLVLAQRCIAEPKRFARGWNFGPKDSDAVSVREVIDGFARHWGRGLKVGWQLVGETAGPHEARFLKLDCSAAHADLGWVPTIGLDRALAMTAEWYKAFYAAVPSSALLDLTRTQIESVAA